MSQSGRIVKNLEAPRPLKSQSRTQLKNYMLIEELIQLIENVALTLSSGVSNPEPMSLLVSNLRIHGPQLEIVSKDTLDRAFVTFRNASQDERLNIMTRLNLLELIELRAKSWQDDGINTYYKHKATNVEPDIATAFVSGLNETTLVASGINTSPINSSSMIGATLGVQPLIAATAILGPGEVLRNSGKFTKPTKIPGKNYSKDEVVIRNADSGKVNPGAKERLVQITGPNEDKITYAKHLIEDTIRRNASPVRLESSSLLFNQSGVVGAEGGGSCSSLASSGSDEALQRASNRKSISSSTAISFEAGNTQKAARNVVGTQPLLHSFSTNDANLGEYKYTVNVGQHMLKITGDCCELVRAAKLVLDDYFSSKDFLASIEAGATFETNSTPATPISAFIPNTHPLTSSSPFGDNGIGLNYMAGHGLSGCNYVEVDDDVFIVEPTDPSSSEPSNAAIPLNGLARSRRSHFSRKDSTPEGNSHSSKGGTEPNKKEDKAARIVHEYERLIHYSKSPDSWKLPRDWNIIVEKHPSLVRNKDMNDQQGRFDAEKYLLLSKSNRRIVAVDEPIECESPDPE